MALAAIATALAASLIQSTRSGPAAVSATPTGALVAGAPGSGTVAGHPAAEASDTADGARITRPGLPFSFVVGTGFSMQRDGEFVAMFHRSPATLTSPGTQISVEQLGVTNNMEAIAGSELMHAARHAGKASIGLGADGPTMTVTQNGGRSVAVVTTPVPGGGLNRSYGFLFDNSPWRISCISDAERAETAASACAAVVTSIESTGA